MLVMRWGVVGCDADVELVGHWRAGVGRGLSSGSWVLREFLWGWGHW
jgi:hypothetical protein